MTARRINLKAQVSRSAVIDPPENTARSAFQSRKAIGQFFRDYRIAQGLQLERVAKDLGLAHASQLEAYESGAEAIPMDEIFALTNLLNISPSEVLSLIQNVYSPEAK